MVAEVIRFPTESINPASIDLLRLMAPSVEAIRALIKKFDLPPIGNVRGYSARRASILLSRDSRLSPNRGGQSFWRNGLNEYVGKAVAACRRAADADLENHDRAAAEKIVDAFIRCEEAEGVYEIVNAACSA